MADEQEEIWEANEPDMDYRKMKQSHEVVNCVVNYLKIQYSFKSMSGSHYTAYCCHTTD